MRWLFKKKIDKRKLAVLVDYENVSRAASEEGKILDLDAVVRQCTDIGEIIFAFIFFPGHFFHRKDFEERHAKNLYQKRFWPLPCPSGDSPMNDKKRKEKDKVDARLRELGDELLEHSDITDLVIISGDGDFAPLAQHAKFHRKRVVLFSGSKVSPLLKRVVDVKYPLPMQ